MSNLVYRIAGVFFGYWFALFVGGITANGIMALTESNHLTFFDRIGTMAITLPIAAIVLFPPTVAVWLWLNRKPNVTWLEYGLLGATLPVIGMLTFGFFGLGSGLFMNGSIVELLYSAIFFPAGFVGGVVFFFVENSFKPKRENG